MAKFNRATLKTRISALINRIAPFDSDPLIQKVEDEEVRTDVADSCQFLEADQQVLNVTTESFNVDYSSFDEVVVDLTSLGFSEFEITFQGLETQQNKNVKLVVIKNSNQTIAFTNSRYSLFAYVGDTNRPTDRFQIGQLDLTYNVSYFPVANRPYIAERLDPVGVTNDIDRDDEREIATAKAVNDLRVELLSQIDNPTNERVYSSINANRLLLVDNIRFRKWRNNTVTVTGTTEETGPGTGFAETIFNLPAEYRPNRRVFVALGTEFGSSVAGIINTNGDFEVSTDEVPPNGDKISLEFTYSISN